MRYVIKNIGGSKIVTIFDTVENIEVIKPGTGRRYFFASIPAAEAVRDAMNAEAPKTEPGKRRETFTGSDSVATPPKAATKVEEGSAPKLVKTGKFQIGDRVLHKASAGTIKAKDGIRCTVEFDTGKTESVLTRLLKEGPLKVEAAKKGRSTRKKADATQRAA